MNDVVNICVQGFVLSFLLAYIPEMGLLVNP